MRRYKISLNARQVADFERYYGLWCNDELPHQRRFEYYDGCLNILVEGLYASIDADREAARVEDKGNGV